MKRICILFLIFFMSQPALRAELPRPANEGASLEASLYLSWGYVQADLAKYPKVKTLQDVTDYRFALITNLMKLTTQYADAAQFIKKSPEVFREIHDHPAAAAQLAKTLEDRREAVSQVIEDLITVNKEVSVLPAESLQHYKDQMTALVERVKKIDADHADDLQIFASTYREVGTPGGKPADAHLVEKPNSKISD